VRSRQGQLASWAASSARHLPDGPAAQRRDAYLARLPEHLSWIHGHDVLA
jgi:salicylate hydroxylase